MSLISKSADGKPRCSWCMATPDYIAYHDNEWGYPVDNDIRLFEKLCLESFQSGLSWRTILAKRENFRSAFQHFDFHKVAQFKEKHIKQLLANEGIVRHRGKIEAAINNAKCAQEMIAEYGSLAAFFWHFEPEKNALAKHQARHQMVTTTKESIALSKALKKKGWKFVGPTTMYAFMQAMGLVNDHAEDCFFWGKANSARKKFSKPKTNTAPLY